MIVKKVNNYIHNTNGFIIGCEVITKDGSEVELMKSELEIGLINGNISFEADLHDVIYLLGEDTLSVFVEEPELNVDIVVTSSINSDDISVDSQPKRYEYLEMAVTSSHLYSLKVLRERLIEMLKNLDVIVREDTRLDKGDGVLYAYTSAGNVNLEILDSRYPSKLFRQGEKLIACIDHVDMTDEIIIVAFVKSVIVESFEYMKHKRLDKIYDTMSCIPDISVRECLTTNDLVDLLKRYL